MDYGSTGMSNPLTVTGNVTANGNLSLGDAFGGDLILSGNWTRGAGTFSPNNREVEFNGTALQTLTGATTFDYLKINNNGNIVQLASAINIDDGQLLPVLERIERGPCFVERQI